MVRSTDSSDPLTSLRFGGRSKRRKRQKLLIRTDHVTPFTLEQADPARQVDLSPCSRLPDTSRRWPWVHQAGGVVATEVEGRKQFSSVLAIRYAGAAAHVDGLARHEVGLVGGDEDHRPGDLLGAAGALERHLAASVDTAKPAKGVSAQGRMCCSAAVAKLISGW